MDRNGILKGWNATCSREGEGHLVLRLEHVLDTLLYVVHDLKTNKVRNTVGLNRR